MQVLVPRPLPQGKNICRLIKQHGGIAIHFPVIEITGPVNLHQLRELAENPGDINLMIFVSVSAVLGVSRVLTEVGVTIPQNIKVATVGRKTAGQCQACGINVDYIPTTKVSGEGLLEALKGFAMPQSRVVIFRGQSGRELLKTSLEALGASVEYIESYRRILTERSIEPLLARWKGGGVDLVVITSSSILYGLLELLGKTHSFLLKQTPIVTISDRIAKNCRQIGVTSPVTVAPTPYDSDVLFTIQNFNQYVK